MSVCQTRAVHTPTQQVHAHTEDTHAHAQKHGKHKQRANGIAYSPKHWASRNPVSLQRKMTSMRYVLGQVEMRGHGPWILHAFMAFASLASPPSEALSRNSAVGTVPVCAA